MRPRNLFSPTLSDVFVCLQGGTAGAALASRLSEVKDFQVLVIEAGPTYAQLMPHP
jgi:choline dehydrogenase-like flavoprotein